MLLQILNMSFMASFIIIIVLFARLLLKKVPKIFSYVLWSAVLFRLLCPFSLESSWSLLPVNSTPISSDIIYSEAAKVNTGLNSVDNIVNPVLPTPTRFASINPLQIYILIGEIIWLVGFIVIILYSIVTLLRLRQTLVGAVVLRNNIYLADHIASPFVIGLFRPRIYLPSTLSEQEREYIILHEQTHIRRRDYMIKLIAFFALAMHWFNPLVWLAFVLFNKDMEMSCDESVMKHMDGDIRCDYSTSLLSLATGRKIIAGTPLAFGEGDTKVRIKNVMKYRKPKFGVFVVTAVFVVAICIGMMIDPIKRVDAVNLTDIDEMNIGAEMPQLLYGDSNMVIMNGTFGLMVYSLETSEIINRISFDELEKLGITHLIADVSQDGSIIYLGNVDENFEHHFTHQYNLRTNSIKKYYGQAVDTYQPTFISPGYEEQYDQYFDLHYLISDTIVELDNSLIYLRASTDWSMKSLQIVVCEYEGGTIKVYPVFHNDLISIPENMPISGQGEGTTPAQANITYTHEEINAAISAAETYFQEVATSRILERIWYDEEAGTKMRVSYMNSGKGHVNGIEEENVIVLQCNFEIKDDPAFAGQYLNWNLIFIRESNDAPWVLDDQGV